MSKKRTAEVQLTQETPLSSDEDGKVGFTKASEEEISARIIKVPKSRKSAAKSAPVVAPSAVPSSAFKTSAEEAKPNLFTNVSLVTPLASSATATSVPATGLGVVEPAKSAFSFTSTPTSTPSLSLFKPTTGSNPFKPGSFSFGNGTKEVDMANPTATEVDTAPKGFVFVPDLKKSSSSTIKITAEEFKKTLNAGGGGFQFKPDITKSDASVEKKKKKEEGRVKEYLAKSRGLNVHFLQKLEEEVKKDESINLSEIIAQYKTYRREIDQSFADICNK